MSEPHSIYDDFAYSDDEGANHQSLYDHTLRATDDLLKRIIGTDAAAEPKPSTGPGPSGAAPNNGTTNGGGRTFERSRRPDGPVSSTPTLAMGPAFGRTAALPDITPPEGTAARLSGSRAPPGAGRGRGRAGPQPRAEGRGRGAGFLRTAPNFGPVDSLSDEELVVSDNESDGDARRGALSDEDREEVVVRLSSAEEPSPAPPGASQPPHQEAAAIDYDRLFSPESKPSPTPPALPIQPTRKARSPPTMEPASTAPAPPAPLPQSQRRPLQRGAYDLDAEFSDEEAGGAGPGPSSDRAAAAAAATAATRGAVGGGRGKGPGGAVREQRARKSPSPSAEPAVPPAAGKAGRDGAAAAAASRGSPAALAADADADLRAELSHLRQTRGLAHGESEAERRAAALASSQEDDEEEAGAGAAGPSSSRPAASTAVLARPGAQASRRRPRVRFADEDEVIIIEPRPGRIGGRAPIHRAARAASSSQTSLLEIQHTGERAGTVDDAYFALDGLARGAGSRAAREGAAAAAELCSTRARRQALQAEGLLKEMLEALAKAAGSPPDPHVSLGAALALAGLASPDCGPAVLASPEAVHAVASILAARPIPEPLGMDPEDSDPCDARLAAVAHFPALRLRAEVPAGATGGVEGGWWARDPSAVCMVALTRVLDMGSGGVGVAVQVVEAVASLKERLVGEGVVGTLLDLAEAAWAGREAAGGEDERAYATWRYCLALRLVEGATFAQDDAGRAAAAHRAVAAPRLALGVVRGLGVGILGEGGPALDRDAARWSLRVLMNLSHVDEACATWMGAEGALQTCCEVLASLVGPLQPSALSTPPGPGAPFPGLLRHFDDLNLVVGLGVNLVERVAATRRGAVGWTVSVGVAGTDSDAVRAPEGSPWMGSQRTMTCVELISLVLRSALLLSKVGGTEEHAPSGTGPAGAGAAPAAAAAASLASPSFQGSPDPGSSGPDAGPLHRPAPSPVPTFPSSLSPDADEDRGGGGRHKGSLQHKRRRMNPREDSPSGEEVTEEMMTRREREGEASSVVLYLAVLLGFLAAEPGTGAHVEAIVSDKVPEGGMGTVRRGVEDCLGFYVRTGSITRRMIEGLKKIIAHLRETGAAAAAAAAAEPQPGPTPSDALNAPPRHPASPSVGVSPGESPAPVPAAIFLEGPGNQEGRSGHMGDPGFPGNCRGGCGASGSESLEVELLVDSDSGGDASMDVDGAAEGDLEGGSQRPGSELALSPQRLVLSGAEGGGGGTPTGGGSGQKDVYDYDYDSE